LPCRFPVSSRGWSRGRVPTSDSTCGDASSGPGSAPRWSASTRRASSYATSASAEPSVARSARMSCAWNGPGTPNGHAAAPGGPVPPRGQKPRTASAIILMGPEQLIRKRRQVIQRRLLGP
jgi:hypothetical protein